MTTETPVADVVERLHLYGGAAFPNEEKLKIEKVCLEAADEITRLRAENAELRETVRRVQRSARSLTAAQKEIYEHYQKASSINSEAVATLDSEREANAILTAENAELQRKLDEVVEIAVYLDRAYTVEAQGVEDTLLVVSKGAKVSSVSSARKRLSSIRGEA